MPPKKFALVGEPDFHNLSDEKLKSFLDMTQQLIFAYNGYDDGKVKALSSIWKDLSVENTARICNRPDKSPSVRTTPGSLLKKVPKIRKSPAKR